MTKPKYTTPRFTFAVAAVHLLLAAAAPAADLEKTDLFKVGDQGYNLYHIPGIAVTAKGTVLAVCEARKNAGHDWADHQESVRTQTKTD